MNEIEEKQEYPIQTEVVEFSSPSPESTEPVDFMANLVIPVLRRWYIVLLIFILICGTGGTLIYYFMGKKYDTEGSIKVSMLAPRILYDIDNQSMPYNIYKNTLAETIGLDNVLNRAADELKDENIIFLNSTQSPVNTLRKMIINGNINVDVPRDNELMYIRMTTDFPIDAEKLIDALLRSFMAVVAEQEHQGDDETLSVLEQRRRVLEEKIEVQKMKVRARAEEFGTSELSPYQESLQQQMATLQDELISIAIQRIRLETEINMKENNQSGDPDPEEIALRQAEYVESDPLILALRENIQRYNELIREGQIIMQDSNPELIRRIEILSGLQEQLDAREIEIAEKFEEEITNQIARSQRKELDQLKQELDQTVAYESRIRGKLDEIDTSTIGIGHKQFEIDDAQEELDQMRQIYNELSTRIEQMNLERARQPRISVASFARSVEAKGKRRKMAMATAFGGLACGIGLALLLEKLDKRLKMPKDVTKRVGVRIIGTTTDPHGISKKLLPQQIVDDYQAILTNITLLDDCEGLKMIAVTSPGKGDGKTTFSINLAVTFARSGKRTLLIDGDLRKPDVGNFMNLPPALRGLQDYLFGKELNKSVYRIYSPDLYVLAADDRNAHDASELIMAPKSIERLQQLRSEFDCVIVDTPPVLACSETLLWAKMADGVVVLSFLGHTSKVDMKEARERLEQINANILGTVVNNVKVSQGYQRYGYGYADHPDPEKRRHSHKKSKSNTLIYKSNLEQDAVCQDEMKA